MIARACKQEKSLGIDGNDGVVMGQWVWLQGTDGGGESGQFGEGERNRDEAGVNRRRSWGGTSALVPELVVGEVPGTGGLPRSLVLADAAAPKHNLFYFFFFWRLWQRAGVIQHPVLLIAWQQSCIEVKWASVCFCCYLWVVILHYCV